MFHNSHSVSYWIVIFLLIILSAIVLWDANWVFEIFWADDYQLVSTTAMGRPSHSYTGSGRFWPLGLCDYCLLLLIPYGKTITAHLIYNCVTMIIASLLFFEFLKKLVGRNSYVPVFCMLILFSISSFVLIHMACIYPERQMFFMLSVFLFFYQKVVDGNHDVRNYAMAFFAAVYTTYLKEPAFGIWIIFAVANLIFGKLSLREHRFNYALLGNSFVWMTIYMYRTFFRDRTFIDGGAAYARVSDNVQTVFSNFLNQFNQEPFLYMLLILAVYRTYIILRKRVEYNFCDALLFSGVGYVFAYVILNVQANHYCFPTIILGVGAFAMFLARSQNYIKFVIILCSIMCSLVSIPVSLSWISATINHRATDPSMFEKLINLQKSGKKILWLTEPGKEVITKETMVELDQMKFRRYQIFLDYYSGHHQKFHFPFKKVSDYSKINEDTIVICSNETLASEHGKKLIEKLKEVGLVLMHSNDEMGSKIFWK
ncbi:MAG: hypothetical protein E7015_03005 [Alphaproteobacteria bacterium]|nr:hypothetical protein [Alphaproteobacteria bacterium]